MKREPYRYTCTSFIVRYIDDLSYWMSEYNENTNFQLFYKVFEKYMRVTYKSNIIITKHFVTY